MPDYEAEDDSLVTNLLGSRGSYGNRLRVHHLPHHAARAICRTHQYRVDPQLLRRYPLQASKQRIGGCVTPCECDAEPAQKRAEERIQPPRSRKCQSQNSIKTRVAGYITQSEHEGDSDHGQPHADQCAPEDFHELTGANPSRSPATMAERSNRFRSPKAS